MTSNQTRCRLCRLQIPKSHISIIITSDQSLSVPQQPKTTQTTIITRVHYLYLTGCHILSGDLEHIQVAIARRAKENIATRMPLHLFEIGFDVVRPVKSARAQAVDAQLTGHGAHGDKFTVVVEFHLRDRVVEFRLGLEQAFGRRRLCWVE